jgi:hypothetical protein
MVANANGGNCGGFGANCIDSRDAAKCCDATFSHELHCGLLGGLLGAETRPSRRIMLSAQNRVPNEKGEVTPFPPHIMIYAPYLTNKDIGVDRTNLGPDGNPIGPAFVAGDGTPYALLIIPLGAHDGAHAMPDPAATDN